jgi:hypothetical protein
LVIILPSNFSREREPGEHWFAILKLGPRELEVFDSLGTSLEFVKSTIPYKGNCSFNISAVQSIKSSHCGEYCLYYLVQRLFNLDMPFELFMNVFFTDCLEDNDAKVCRFMKDLIEK